MTSIFNALQFGTPLALLGLAALPVIWWLLRFTPPRPQQVLFPPIRILLGLPTQKETPDKTPWWLLALRLALAAMLVFAVSQPFLQPQGAALLPNGHRLIVIDDGWAAAGNWTERRNFLLDVLEQARTDGATVTLVGTTPFAGAMPHVKSSPQDTLERARLLKPSALNTEREALLEKLASAELGDVATVIWLADGLDAGTANTFAGGLKKIAPLKIYANAPQDLPHVLGPLVFEGSDIKATVFRNASSKGEANVQAIAANGRVLAESPVTFGTATEKPITINLPTALRNEITAISLANEKHAGAEQLFDDRWRRRSIALMSSDSNQNQQMLLSPLHYLKRGLEPFAELFEPQTESELAAQMDAGLTMIVLADVGDLTSEQVEKFKLWTERGGILLRFAGPHMATAQDETLPVKLRQGDRALGSSLSWETPQGLSAFPDNSPFAGIAVDPAVKVQRQLLAEPSPELADRTWASLEDGTPLVTAEKRGKGLVVLFHTTANANWSNLPLSGMFLTMLQHVAGLDPQAAATGTDASEPLYVPSLLLTGEGALAPADGTVKPVSIANMEKAVASFTTPPGLYVRQGRERAVNHRFDASTLLEMAPSVAGTSVEAFTQAPRKDLAPYLFLAAAVAFVLDTIITVFLGGGLRRAVAATLFAVSFLVLPMPQDLKAQEAKPSDLDFAAALETRLAFVKTGDSDVDATSEAGLKGLSLVMTDRTAATLGQPIGVDINTDELVFFPILYWPVIETAEPLPEATRNKLAAYMKNGGMVFFDTRDGGLDATLNGGGNAALQKILSGLPLPPLEPVPEKHVLTRSFYLLDRFPGRYEGPAPWVEAQGTGNAGLSEAADGISPIIIGANDYAAAWALNNFDEPLNAVIPGTDRQREFAFRTGVNIVMYALTGNYKADQVHIPAFLERLGQ